MKRSNFIKSLLGIVAVPFVAVKAMDSLMEDKSVTDIVDNCDKTETPKNESWLSKQEEEAARAWQESYDRLINEGHRSHSIK